MNKIIKYQPKFDIYEFTNKYDILPSKGWEYRWTEYSEKNAKKYIRIRRKDTNNKFKIIKRIITEETIFEHKYEKK